MTLSRPAAVRPLALLTLAVLAAHLLVLAQAGRRQPPPAGLRTLVTRVVNAPGPQAQPQPQPPAPAPVQPPVPQERQPTPRPRLAPPTPEAPPAARNTSALAEPIAAATPEPPAAPASAPAMPADSDPAAAPPVASASASTDAAAPAPAIAYAIPGSVRLRYAVTGRARGQSWNVTGELLWRQDGERYEAQLDYSAPLLPFSRTQRSTGQLRAEGLSPYNFSDKGSRSEQATHFERDTRTLIFSNNAPEQPLQPGTQDRLSVFLQLGAMLAAAPEKFPAGTAITLTTAGTRDAQPWTFTVEADEALDLPGGRVATRKLTRQPGAEYDIRVELWLGTGMDYVPVRIRLTQPNGDFVDQQWSSTDRP